MQNANFTQNAQGGGQSSGTPGQCLGEQRCGAAQSQSDCTALGAPCSWEAPNANQYQRGMKFFSNMTYSIGYGRHEIFSDKWTYNGWSPADVAKVPRSFQTTSYALDLKVPSLSWFECEAWDTCSWTTPSAPPSGPGTGPAPSGPGGPAPSGPAPSGGACGNPPNCGRGPPEPACCNG